MRRGIEIRTAFSPTRMSATHLRAVYQVVSPAVERTIAAGAERPVVGKCDRLTVRRRQGGAVKSIAIYARVSSAKQQAQEATIDSQVAALKERVAADGHMLLPQDVYLDDGFQRLDVGAARARAVARSGRRGRHRPAVRAQPRPPGAQACLPGAVARRAAQAGLVTTVFLNGPSGKTAEDELLWCKVQGMIAEYERAKILERSRRGKDPSCAPR